LDNMSSRVRERSDRVEGPERARAEAYLDAYRTPTDPNSKISEFLSSERWKGFTPAPMPEK